MAKKRSDWYPHGRQKQLDFSKRFLSVLSEPAEGQGSGGKKKKWQAWGIPPETFTAVEAACQKAASALEAVITTGTRGGPLNSAVQVTFTELERLNRDIKRRYIFSPPLSREELDAINVKERSTTRTSRPAPKHTVSLKVSNPELHAVLLALSPEIFDDEDISDFTFNIRVGILSPDGTIPERSLSASYYMAKVPVIPEDLPKQYSRRRRKETFTFTAADAGKTVYFCVCLQNAKGETGPWSQMITAIIT